MIWADHLVHNEEIRNRLRKDVIVIEWSYAKEVKADAVKALGKAGFDKLITAPSLACSLHRFLPTTAALENTQHMTSLAVKYKAMGVINTAWCPWRYLQNALYYGIAYSAFVTENCGKINMQQFHREFADKVFGTQLSPPLNKFLCSWTKLDIDHEIAPKLIKENSKFSAEQKKKLRSINEIGKEIILLAEKYHPDKNEDIWNGMVLAVKAAWLCSEKYMLCQKPDSSTKRKELYNALLRQTQEKLSNEWDATRFEDDPQKFKARYARSEQEHQYALILIKRLRYIK